MTIAIKHAFTSLKGDGLDTTQVQPSNWNAAHSLTLASGQILGRLTAGSGAVEEIPISSYMAGLLNAADALTLATILGVFETGDVKYTMKPTTTAGWVLCTNGYFNIGNAASGANIRANVDTFNLFVLLYNACSDAILPVSGGRTGNALNDFNANKTIALPQLAGRSPIGAGAGGPSVSARVLGTTYGEETHTLTTAELSSHTHNNSLSDPQHSHGNTINNPAHYHAATVTDPGHAHGNTLSDPGHITSTTLTDPGHYHTAGTNDPGHTHGNSLNDPQHYHGVSITQSDHTHSNTLNDPGHNHTGPYIGSTAASTNVSPLNYNAWSNQNTATQFPGTGTSYTGISISNAGAQASISAVSAYSFTGITLTNAAATTSLHIYGAGGNDTTYSAFTGISLNNPITYTGLTINNAAAATGLRIYNPQTGYDSTYNTTTNISINNASSGTGITLTNAAVGSGTPHNVIHPVVALNAMIKL